MVKLFKFCFIFLLSFNVQATHSITVGTYSSPPFSMHEDHEQIGLATEALRDLLAKSGIIDYTIVDYPLARGLFELKNQRIDILYPYVTTEKPTEDYVLIGPISKYRVALFVRKDYKLPVSIKAMQDLVVGAERGSIGDNLLLNNNMHVEQSTQEISCLRMVIASRIAACATGTLPGMYVAALNSLYDELRYVETDLYADMYVAIGPSMPQATVQALKNTYAKLKKANYFEIKQKDYEKKFNIFIESMTK